MNFIAISAAQSNPVEQHMNPTFRARYRAQAWLRANTAFGRTGKKDFARMLKKSAYPIQKVYRQLMEAYAGEPIGVECRSTSLQNWAFVVPETGVPGQFRVQYFDEDGFTGHCVHSKMEEAVETMLREGYRIAEAGALDKVASTARWARGVHVAALRQRCQEGLMSFSDMVEAIKAL
ncbi:hypothetical protein G3A43_07790 [Paraburkholderia aspalathi]|nr:hypothetical protein [Paraburkholderia aspalathi]MBK3780157.1 hypothetical protein [Paraburkholderia aspalathi]